MTNTTVLADALREFAPYLPTILLVLFITIMLGLIEKIRSRRKKEKTK